MLDANYIRTQILLISDAGPLVAQVVENVVREAHRYGRECAGRPVAGVDPGPAREELGRLLSEVRKSRRRDEGGRLV